MIIGWYGDASGGDHGFLRARDGSITSFDAPPGGFIVGSFYFPCGLPPSVNPAGDIAGTYVDPASWSTASCGLRRHLHDHRFPGRVFHEALAINPAGVIVGDFCNAVTCYQGFVRTPDGTFTEINANAGIPFGINPAGAITGFAADGSGLSAASRRHLHHVQSAGLHSHRFARHQPGGRDHGVLL